MLRSNARFRGQCPSDAWEDPLKICVFGAGAIGGFIGFHLARAHAEVSLVARGAHLAAVRKNGLRLIAGDRDDVVKMPVEADGHSFGIQDFVIITLKAHTLDDALPSIAPLLGPHTTVVTAYNGLPYWFFRAVPGPFTDVTLKSIDPEGRQWAMLGTLAALGCVVLPATELVSPGVIRHDHGMRFPIGEPSGGASARLEGLHQLLVAAGFEAPMRDDIRDEIWLKLWGNLCLNPISLLTQATVDRVAGDAGTRAVCIAMMGEAETIGTRLGLRLRVGQQRRLDGAAALGAHKMSMLQDLERGRSLEIDPLVGVIQEMGVRLNVATPVTDIVLALARQRAQSV
jgi:2-dehydropantoate 2-reductase